MGGETHDASGQPLQDVLETREDVSGSPLPSKQQGIQADAGLVMS